MTKPPPTRFSVKSNKTFVYRSVTKEWSNRYFFTGGPPSSSAHWLTLYDAIQTLEKACFSSVVSLIGGVGYEAGSEVPVWSGGSLVAGTVTPGGNDRLMPGDCTRLIRWTTDARTGKNHPIYLFKYFHGVYNNSADPADIPSSVNNVGLVALRDGLVSGVSDGVNTYHLCGPYGAVALVGTIQNLIGHRDFVS